MMRQFGVIILLALSASLQAQNEYRLGDVLHTQQVSYKSFDKTEGKDLLWIMDGCKILQDDYQVRFVPNRDSIYHASLSRLESGVNYRYSIQDDSVLIKGFKNKIIAFKYDLPEVYMRLPLKYNDEVSGVYAGKGVDTMGRFVRIFGKYKANVCGQGSLVTIDGDTLRNTLLVHTRRLICSSFSDAQELLSTFGSLDSVPPLSSEDIVENMQHDSDAVALDDYRWFAPGYRYAILETIRCSKIISLEAPIFQTAYYYAIDDQANLLDDEENIAIREKLGKDRQTEMLAQQSNEIVSRFIVGDKIDFVTKASSNCLDINMDYRTEGSDRYSVALFNLSGIQLYRNDLGIQRKGFHTAHFAIGNLSKGVYVLTVFVNGKPYSKELSF